ncbi:type-F conjugative transfer system pilin assembly protein TrbC [Candidatus Tisiphia endosymbiont of Nemotelus uliginosus]|uniref:type-F conjugative transfer system pilin assembly protein TrbC n=1 Tax=Candidatus Tisiphia endosymbiont of Nemotelus uliginosus TaxID=3077926 RepID=UPI0035C88757
MAKNELLFFLKVLLLAIVTISSNINVYAKDVSKTINDCASNAASSTSTASNELLQEVKNLQPTDEQLNWGKDARNAGQILTRNAMWQKLGELDAQQNKQQAKNLADQELVANEFVDPKAVVKVFVSNGMPENLLRQYHRQVVQYGGTLVFKGLPKGSFKELAKLVMTISENGEAGSMQIDDEAFDYFAISTVPTILLIKEEDCLGEQSSKVTYDKITGSIGIKVALEKFAANGDLSQEAKRLLEK